MRRFGVARGLCRVEDQRLLTGQGCFCDDVNLAGQAPAVVVRSPVVHAEVRRHVNALAPLGVRHIDMPATPERVWRAIRQAAAQAEARPNNSGRLEP